jgi:hypothetical protein
MSKIPEYAGPAMPEGGRFWVWDDKREVSGKWVNAEGEDLDANKVIESLEKQIAALLAKKALAEANLPKEPEAQDPLQDTRPLIDRPMSELKEMATAKGLTFPGNISRYNLSLLLTEESTT